MRAKSHDQRKGQWLINRIRSERDPWDTFAHMSKEEIRAKGVDNIINALGKKIEMRIWNMENDEFDRIMEDYDK